MADDDPMGGAGPASGASVAQRGPSAARRRAVEARAEALRRDLELDQHPARPGRRARPRLLMWSLALVVLFASSRPTSARAAGPKRGSWRGLATVGGHRLSDAGEAARISAGDVLTVGPEGRLELGIGAGRVALLGGGRLLVERLGPPALRLLSGDADVLGPIVLQTLAGTLRVPAGVEIRAAGTGAGGPGPRRWSSRSTGPGWSSSSTRAASTRSASRSRGRSVAPDVGRADSPSRGAAVRFRSLAARPRRTARADCSSDRVTGARGAAAPVGARGGRRGRGPADVPRAAACP